MKISTGDKVRVNSVVDEKKYADVGFPIDPSKRKCLGRFGIIKGRYRNMVRVKPEYTATETYFFFEEDLTPINDEKVATIKHIKDEYEISYGGTDIRVSLQENDIVLSQGGNTVILDNKVAKSLMYLLGKVNV